MPIRRADESKNYEAAIPQLNKLPELLKHWSATKEQSRTLYLLAYRIFSGAHRQCVPPDILCVGLASSISMPCGDGDRPKDIIKTI